MLISIASELSKLAPAVDVWIHDEKGLQGKLESSIETLASIQAALGEYLQKQRAAFPRFFFVGDEDLLEILGNGKDPIRVNRHLGKMFAGIVSLRVDETAEYILGMQSKEGGALVAHCPIQFSLYAVMIESRCSFFSFSFVQRLSISRNQSHCAKIRQSTVGSHRSRRKCNRLWPGC